MKAVTFVSSLSIFSCPFSNLHVRLFNPQTVSGGSCKLLSANLTFMNNADVNGLKLFIKLKEKKKKNLKN